MASARCSRAPRHFGQPAQAGAPAAADVEHARRAGRARGGHVVASELLQRSMSGEVHAERYGSDGATYLAARKH